MSKLEYLKKYMDGNDTKKKKKRIKKTHNNIKIIDDQIMFKDTQIVDDIINDQFATAEEKPLLFSTDGSTVITKEHVEHEDKMKARWAPLPPEKRSSPRARKRRHDSSDSDMSPEREKQVSSDSDLSPVRKTLSQSHRKQRHDSENSDFSPVRKLHEKNSNSDFSPQRTKNNYKHRHHEDPQILTVGKQSGLRSGSELRLENKAKRAYEKTQIESMDQELSGKGAKTVYRDHKTGKKIDVKFEELERKKREEEKIKENEKYAVWGKGVVQDKNYQQKLQDDLTEMEKPLARYKTDTDLDEMLKKKTRDDDPMLEYMMKMQSKKSKISKLRYKGSNPPMNRFNIWPGYRYDSVDRSNGFENRRFIEINKRKSLATESYKWSVEEM